MVHLSGDFPDPVDPGKTAAVLRLVELTQDRFDHEVMSLNRRSPGQGRLSDAFRNALSPPRLTLREESFAYGHAIEYSAPGYGLWHRTMLETLGEQLADRIAAAGPLPDLIVGHKLTIEGIATRRMADRLRVPYALSIQGNTDTRILAARPDLRNHLREIFHDAAMVFSFAPWALRQVEARLGERTAPSVVLPCALGQDVTLPPRPSGGGLVTVFNLRHWRNKGFDRTVAALRASAGPARRAGLTVIGGGDEATLARCRELAGPTGLVSFAGPVENGEIPARLNRATALVLPSRRESFGMVFIEALFAGIPIIYPAGTAVDGYFDGEPFALRVDAGSTASIAAAMDRAVTHEEELKAALADWQNSPRARRFTREAIGDAFASGLHRAASGAI
ncbi:2-deoxystreptamine glucosyltransferase [Tsuneonella dongtanensis]|uniref:2-deoxystreptamine glucosyltransferase n=1 Tax=Tsuneonella dongtanensis TaxID=692370 RepID=A0A1B2AB89_9SPHN|nr:2-deoxystreptamine glucosyltransferase [Tsuneonella dongtanensis]